jgi:hypothetical protein
MQAGERLQLFGKMGERRGTGGIEGRAQQQVFGRVAGKCKFGSDSSFAPSLCASRAAATTFATLPAKSPTVTLI